MHYRFWGLLDSCLAASDKSPELHQPRLSDSPSVTAIEASRLRGRPCCLPINLHFKQGITPSERPDGAVHAYVACCSWCYRQVLDATRTGCRAIDVDPCYRIIGGLNLEGFCVGILPCQLDPVNRVVCP